MTPPPGAVDGEPDRPRDRARRETDLRDWRSGEGRVLGARIPPPRDGHLSAAVPPGTGASTARIGDGDGGEVSDAFFTLPNLISMARIALIPVLVLAILVWESPGWALVLLAVLVASDWLDGKIARLWDMRSRWGERLDPIADRILVAVVPVTFALAGYVPVWVVVVLLARDLVLVGTLVVYRRRGLEPEVIYLGKAATFALFWSFPLVLAGRAEIPGAGGFEVVGLACLYWGMGLYLWSGAVYLWQAVRVARTVPRGV